MGGTGGYQVDGDSAQFSNLINELMRMNYHQMANQPASQAAKGGNVSSGGGATKGRANSEKHPSTANAANGVKQTGSIPQQQQQNASNQPSCKQPFVH